MNENEISKEDLRDKVYLNLAKTFDNNYDRVYYIDVSDNNFYKYVLKKKNTPIELESHGKDFFAEAVTDSTRSGDEIKEASCVLAHVAVLQKDAEALLKYSLKDAATEMCSEMCCELGEYYYGKEDYDEAIVWFYNAAYECASIIDIKTGKEIPRLALAKCYKALGNEEQAADYEKEAAEIEKGE